MNKQTRQLKIIETRAEVYCDAGETFVADAEVESEEICDCEPDEIDRNDGLTVVDLAARLIRDAGCTSPSCSGGTGFTAQDWFTSTDQQADIRTGDILETACFFIGPWSDADAAAVAAEVLG